MSAIKLIGKEFSKGINKWRWRFQSGGQPFYSERALQTDAEKEAMAFYAKQPAKTS
jgi:hypothetical protein